MKVERKEACLGGASREHQQSGGRSSPNFSPHMSSLQSGSLPSSGSIFARPQSSPVAAVPSPIPGCSVLGERICRKLLCSVVLLCKCY